MWYNKANTFSCRTVNEGAWRWSNQRATMQSSCLKTGKSVLHGTKKRRNGASPIVDVIEVLTDSPNPQTYWRVMKKRLKDEGNETVTNCNALKMTAADGKKRLTDVANTEQLLRIIQSVPSPKAEPFKAWLAMVGRERIDETIDPEQAIDRALETYLKKGYTEEWVHQRLLAIRIRNELTDEWSKCGVEKGKEYAILTDEISRAWSGSTTRQHKMLKGLKKRKPPRQHERHGTCVDDAGRSFHNGIYPK